MAHYSLRPTTLVNTDSSPNPFYSKVDALYDAAEPKLLDDIGDFVDELQAQGLDEAEIMSCLMEKFGDSVDKLIDVFENTPETPQPLPPAPSPISLYSRVDAVPILDIGSGNCSKLSTCQSKVIATDAFPQENNHFPVRQLDFYGPDFEPAKEIICGNEYRVVTSFNAVTNVADAEGVYNCDGLHVFPDIEHLKKFHGAVEVEGGAVTAGYTDLYNQITSRGDILSPGYKIMTTYAEAKYRFEPVGFAQGEGFSPVIRSLHYAKDLQSSPKYDGVAMILNCGKEASLRVRSGLAVKLDDVSPTKGNFTLMLEKLPKDGPAQAYVLLRVYHYKNWFPYHGLDSLKMFCERIKVKIGGISVRPPGHHLLDDFPTDGVIFRDGEEDFRYKDISTVDLIDPSAVVADLRDQFGFDVVVGQYPIDDQVKEFSMRCVSVGKFQLDYICHRRDKSHGDSLNKIIELIQ